MENKNLSLFSFIKTALKKLPIFSKLISEREKLRLELNKAISEREKLRLELSKATSEQDKLFVPPGHFYSPIPSLEEVRRDESKIFNNHSPNIIGIDLRETEQLNLLNHFIVHYNKMPFKSNKTEELRYYFDNPAYSYSDAILLHCMLRYLKPKRIIEVGSGFSSCMMLDTNDLFFNGSIEITFIEPYPELFISLIKDEDKSNIKIVASRLQDVDLSEFQALKANDILFIDSTHVSKINSDVNTIFFEILPRLSSGVHIHFHDIFFPFEYPKDWVYEGRAWNEIYLLRTFLQYNNEFIVVLMNTFMEHFHESFFKGNMPLCLQNCGGSIWIRKE